MWQTTFSIMLFSEFFNDDYCFILFRIYLSYMAPLGHNEIRTDATSWDLVCFICIAWLVRIKKCHHTWPLTPFLLAVYPNGIRSKGWYMWFTSALKEWPPLPTPIYIHHKHLMSVGTFKICVRVRDITTRYSMWYSHISTHANDCGFHFKLN